MNENIAIIAQLLIFLFFFSTPLNIFNKKIIFKTKYISVFDCLVLNIFFHLNLFLIFSFLNVNIQIYFYTIIILNLIFNFIYLKKILEIKINTNEFYIFSIFFIICLSIFFDISANLRLEWDALSHWIFKARNFYEGVDIQNLKNLDFPEYPHLGTFVWGFFWKNSFLELEYFGRLFYVFFYLVSLCSINKYLFRNNIYLFSINFLLITILTYDPFILSGYQEYLIFSTLVIISRFILIFRTNMKNLLILIFISHLLMWFKDEGMFYFIIFCSLIVYFSKLDLKNKIISILIIISLPVIQYYLQNFVIGNFSFQAKIIHSDLEKLLNINVLYSKIILIIKFMFISIIKYKLMMLYFLSILFIYFCYQRNFPLIKFFLVSFIFNFGLFFAIYLHTPHDISFLLRVTLDRLIFQTSGFYLIIILLLNKKLFQTFNYRSI